MNDGIKETVQKRVNETLSLLSKLPEKNTMLYLKGLNSLKQDCEIIGAEEMVNNVCSEIIHLVTSGEVKNISKNDNVSDILLNAYDSRARMGDLRSYCIAVEWDRPLEKQFFIPRMRILEKHGLIQDFQDLIDGKLDILIVNLPPRIGKSTLSLFLLTFMAALNPDGMILGNGHSASLTQSFYKEFLNICTSPEYRFNKIFPTLSLVDQSAEGSYIDFNNRKRFHTVMFKSIDGGTTGLAEASTLLYCDDLIKDVETANSPDRLEKLFYTYTSTVQDRKVMRKGKDGEYRVCPELHVGTPWSNMDVMSRLIRIYDKDRDNPRVRVRAIPCYDENGESNFEYDYGKGFPKEYYHNLQASEDPVIFSAKYLMNCIEREGRPFTEDQLNFYYERPDERPDRIISYNDVAHGGDDYMSMPIGYVYGNDIYIEDVLYVNKLDQDKTRPMVVTKIIEHGLKASGFEQNNGGKLYATLIEQDLRRKNYRCNITTYNAPTTKSKLDRIMSCQSEIKGIATEMGNYRIFFKAFSKRKDNQQYNLFMNHLYNWSQKQGSVQKTQQDGAPDSLAGLITNMCGGKTTGKAKSNIDRSALGI